MKAGSDAARGLLWVALAVVLALAWIGPASWLRDDPAVAERAEQAADEAEALALVQPELTAADAQARIELFDLLELAVWVDQAAFWETMLPDPPEGVQLLSLGHSAAQPDEAEGVHLRTVSLELAVETGPDDIESDEPAVAPGGLDATWAWISTLNDRIDMQLLAMELSTTGSAQVSFNVWLRDAVDTLDNVEAEAGAGLDGGG